MYEIQPKLPPTAPHKRSDVQHDVRHEQRDVRTAPHKRSKVRHEQRDVPTALHKRSKVQHEQRDVPKKKAPAEAKALFCDPPIPKATNQDTRGAFRAPRSGEAASAPPATIWEPPERSRRLGEIVRNSLPDDRGAWKAPLRN